MYASCIREQHIYEAHIYNIYVYVLEGEHEKDKHFTTPPPRYHKPRPQTNQCGGETSPLINLEKKNVRQCRKGCCGRAECRGGTTDSGYDKYRYSSVRSTFVFVQKRFLNERGPYPKNIRTFVIYCIPLCFVVYI